MYGLTDYFADPSLMNQMHQIQQQQTAQVPMQQLQPVAPQPKAEGGSSPMQMGQGLMGMFGGMGGGKKPSMPPAGATKPVGQGMGAFPVQSIPGAGMAGGAGGAGNLMSMLGPAALML